MKSSFLYAKRTLTAILKMYHQQKKMNRFKIHTCADRILSNLETKDMVREAERHPS